MAHEQLGVFDPFLLGARKNIRSELRSVPALTGRRRYTYNTRITSLLIPGVKKNQFVYGLACRILDVVQ